MPPERLPQIVWRAGIDLQPLDVRSPTDRAWLHTLVWPGEIGRAERIAAAVEVARADPPLLIAGDGPACLPALAGRAPAEATLVVSTPGVLTYIPRPQREQIADQARRWGRWVTLDALGLHRAVAGRWDRPVGGRGWPRGAFALALDGEVIAAADPLGGAVWPVGAGLAWRAEDVGAHR